MRHAIYLLICAAALQADIPEWFRESATATHPAYPAKTKAVALFNEERVQVDPSGKQLSQIRKAVKILTREGNREAIGAIHFDSKGSKVRDFRAWLIYPTGKTKEYSKKDFVEGSSHPDFTMYSTQRFYLVDASRDVDPGTVFGFEAQLEESTVFSQFTFLFQDDLPHLLSRLQVTVPAGWKAEAKAYQGASDKAEVSGSTFTWQARNLKPVELEPGAPRLRSLLPRVAVSVLPPDGTPMQGGPIAFFRTWKDVSQFKSKLIDPQAEVTGAIESKSAELTAGKSDPIEKVRGLAEYVQKIRYVSVSENAARGGGYTPHKADEVLRVAYGDCKDKANLLRTMLKTIRVESYPVAIYSGDPRATLEDFPSPHQFNHAILAIRVPESYSSPAVFTQEGLGRFLLFDPTDAYVPFGFIPDHEQNSRALVTAGEKGALILTPQTKPADNHTDRSWNLTLTAEGGLKGELVEVSTGQEAFDEHERIERLSKEEYRKGLERALVRSITGADIRAVMTNYDPANQRFKLTLQFESTNYAKIMQDRLWMVRSMPMGFNGVPNANKADREQPLVMDPASFTETVTWKMPSNLKIDELPDGDSMERPYGKYKSSWKQNGEEIVARRELVVESQVIPVADYKAAREFLMRFHGASEAPIVMVRK